MAITTRTAVTNGNATDGESISVTKPGTLVDADRLLTVVSGLSEDGTNKTMDFASTGHNEIGESPIGTSQLAHVELFERLVADESAEPASSVFSDPLVPGTNDWHLAIIQVPVGGLHLTAAFGAPQRGGGLSSTVALPAITTTADNSKIYYAVSARRAITVTGVSDVAITAVGTAQSTTGQTALEVTSFLYEIDVATSGTTVTGETLTLSQSREWEVVAIEALEAGPATNKIEGQNYQLDATASTNAKHAERFVVVDGGTSPVLKGLRSGLTYAIPAEFTVVDDTELGYGLEANGTQPGITIPAADLSAVSFTTSVQVMALFKSNVSNATAGTGITGNEDLAYSVGAGDNFLTSMRRNTGTGGNRFDVRIGSLDASQYDGLTEWSDANYLGAVRENGVGQSVIANGSTVGGPDTDDLTSPPPIADDLVLFRNFNGRFFLFDIFDSALSTSENTDLATASDVIGVMEAATVVPVATTADMHAPETGEWTINLTGFTNASGKTIEAPDGTETTVTSQTLAQMVVSAPVLRTFGSPAIHKLGQAYTWTIRDAGQSANISLTVDPVDGWQLVVVSGWTYAAGPAFVDVLSASSGAGTVDFNTDTIYTAWNTGTLRPDGIPVGGTAGETFDVYHYDESTSDWSTGAITVTLPERDFIVGDASVSFAVAGNVQLGSDLIVGTAGIDFSLTGFLNTVGLVSGSAGVSFQAIGDIQTPIQYKRSSRHMVDNGI